MMKYQSSIRQKIKIGYYAVVIMIVGLSAFTFIELNYLEKKIMSGEAISEFFDATLEVRRFEKNYFLYEQLSDYEENIRYVTRAGELFDANIAAFAAVETGDRIISLRDNLQLYKDLMGRYENLIRRQKYQRTEVDSALKIKLAGDLRRTGKDIITVSEEMSKTERRNLQLLLASSRRILIISISVLIVMVIAIGQIMARMVVKPLKLMEVSMEVIADGRFENIRIDSRDREVVSLTNAFNKMLRELELRQRHLVHSEKLASLGTLLSGVAHELNNPLSNISSSNQILLEEIDEGDREYKKELLAQINEQADRARNIVRSLLEFSRDKDFKKQVLPLKDLFEETIRFVKGQIPAKVSITLDIPGELGITADKQRIQQAFLNLIKNAVEAIAEEGVITVRAGQHRAVDKEREAYAGIYNYLKYRGKCTVEDDTVDIEIHDTGPGIPPEILPKVFDPFFTTKDVGKGSGLGLFIVHEIIEEHDGCIAVDSEPGKGTTFLIRLPEK
ncbi:MAG: ATP-binding protein [Nitrospirota bacterium]